MNIEILSKDTDINEIRETGVAHSPFELELVLFNAIRNGDTKALSFAINNYLNSGLVIGRMSKNPLRQTAYWAVATISVAIHYAILGGLDETVGYTLSDEYIRHIDTLTDIEECIEYLKDKAFELTKAVADNKINDKYSVPVKKALHYVNLHLHERISLNEVATYVRLSPSHISRLFKSETGIGLHEYINSEKLSNSLQMLSQGMPYKTISYQLGFSSESHYISLFKKKYGITPKEYKNMILSSKNKKGRVL